MRDYQKSSASLSLLSSGRMHKHCCSQQVRVTWHKTLRKMYPQLYSTQATQAALNEGDCAVCSVSAQAQAQAGRMSPGQEPGDRTQSSMTVCAALALKPVSPCATPGSWSEERPKPIGGKTFGRLLLRLYVGKGALRGLKQHFLRVSQQLIQRRFWKGSGQLWESSEC